MDFSIPSFFLTKASSLQPFLASDHDTKPSKINMYSNCQNENKII